MGLASSQARLLNLTSRMHQIEYKAAKLQNEKLQMANASRRAYLEYQEATEKTKIQIKSLLTNAAATYVDITSYDNMIEAGFCFVVHGVPAKANTDYKALYHEFIDDEGHKKYSKNPDNSNAISEDEYKEKSDFQYNAISGNETSDIVEDIVCNSVTELQNALTAKYKSSLNGQSVNIEDLKGEEFRAALSNIVTLGDVTIVQKVIENGSDKGWPDPTNSNIDFSRYESSIATNTSFQEVEDEAGLRKAEAKYEADMRRIDMKDRKYDYDLQALDAERNAIKQEMETLKTVAKDNVERTFKLFS